ncbi:MAG: hypothetical protein ACK4TA_17460, partial [Saprospiraceae bacterium]
KQINLIGSSKRGYSQVQQLYNDISLGKVNTDEDIISTFFPYSENAQFYASRLKKKLKTRLINTLFFVDVNQQGFNEYSRAYIICSKQVAATKILLGLNARQAAVPIAEEALKIAVEFEFVDLIISLARDLEIIYGTITGERKKLERINELLNKFLPIMEAEIKAEQCYADIMSYFVSSKATKPEIKNKVEEYAKNMETLFETIASPRFNFIAYLILTLRYEVVNDYKSTLEICNKALSYFEPIESKVPINNIFMFAIKMLAYQVYLGNFKATKLAVQKCFQFSREGTLNWFLTLDYAIISAFHSENFQEAYQYYTKAACNANFEKQPPSMRERWYILEAFIYFFFFTKKLKIIDNNSLKKFRLTRFLNDVPVYSKDKRGANISILVLQILFLLQQQKYGEIIDRTESLKTYMQRYLRQDDTYRSNCFIHMLLTLPDCSFHKKAVLRKAEKYWNKLLEVPMSAANQNAEIEIVPYEMLWEFVLESLDDKWH